MKRTIILPLLFISSFCIASISSEPRIGDNNDERREKNEGYKGNPVYGRIISILRKDKTLAFREMPIDENNTETLNQLNGGEENCWLNVNLKKHFETMTSLEEKHEQVRVEFNKAVHKRKLDSEMLEMMTRSRAAAQRAIHNFGGNAWKIPAGINLGGYGMMKVEDTMLFFHRMKLRNDTHFQVNFLSTNVFDMILISRISMNDLRLFGQYERAISKKESFFYRPTFGELELLLKDVTFKMDGRLRLVQNRLVVEHVISDMQMKSIELKSQTNESNCNPTVEKLEPQAISDYLERLKADLDSWLKDYFNDYLLEFALSDAAANKELHCYDKQKQINLNDFMDHVIRKMHLKLYSMKPRAANVKIPSFSIYSINGVQIRLHSGVIRGMDSFHRQSVATGIQEKKIRKVDAVIGFSKLKVEYKYQAKISGRTPPMVGLFVLTADDLITHLGVSLLEDPETIELYIGYLRQIRSQTLVIEGGINRMVGNFKHILENEIIALMSNVLLFQIRHLSSLTRCEPTLQGHEDEGERRFNGLHGIKGAAKPSYGMMRNDSIEIMVPGTDNRPPKIIHIKHSQNFELDHSAVPQKNETKALDYGVQRKDSIEVELPGTHEKVHINYDHKFSLKKNGTKSSKQPEEPPGANPSKKEYSNNDHQNKGANNKGSQYGVQRNDSIELELPGIGNNPPKKMHINYGHHFKLNEKANNESNQLRTEKKSKSYATRARDDIIQKVQVHHIRHSNLDGNEIEKSNQFEQSAQENENGQKVKNIGEIKTQKHSKYGIQRKDSIELELPGTENHPPKKMHINYGHHFKLNNQLTKEVKQLSSPAADDKLSEAERPLNSNDLETGESDSYEDIIVESARKRIGI